MIAYPVGQEPDFLEPDPADARHRFALGKIAGCTPESPPLVVIGLNPSHARETESESESDRTVNHVIDLSTRAHSGWLMLNLYPESSPKPKSLSPYDAALCTANCEVIEHVLRLVGATEALGAWGNIGGFKTLKETLPGVRALMDKMGVKIFTLDALLKTGNPPHPHPPGRPRPMLGPKVFLS